MVGVIGLAPREHSPGSIELGYYIGRQYWGQGIATEAGAVVVALGIGLVGQPRPRADTSRAQTHSQPEGDSRCDGYG